MGIRGTRTEKMERGRRIIYSILVDIPTAQETRGDEIMDDFTKGVFAGIVGALILRILIVLIFGT